MILDKIALEISFAAADSAVNERKKELANIEHDLAGRVNSDFYPDEHIEIIKKLPQDWWRLDECLRVEDKNGYRFFLKRRPGEGLICPMSTERLHKSLKDINLNNEVFVHINAVRELQKENKAIQTEVYKMIRSIHSVKKMQEIWPEGLEFYRKYIDKNSEFNAVLPSISGINKMLGLKR